MRDSFNNESINLTRKLTQLKTNNGGANPFFFIIVYKNAKTLKIYYIIIDIQSERIFGFL